jgi:hypothetical protein
MSVLASIERRRRVEFAGDGSPASIARQHGCDPSAIAALHPFLVDGTLVCVLAAAAAPPRNAELIACVGARTVRRLHAHELLLAFQLATASPPILMDSGLLDRAEVLFCVEPPLGYAISPPEELRSGLGARVIAL